MKNPTLALPVDRSQKNLGEPYLRLQLDDRNHAALSMEFAQEVSIVPATRLTYMPNSPLCMLGLLNQRSRVYWVVDLPQMLGLEPLASDTQQYNIAIIQARNVSLAVAIKAVQGVKRFVKESIQSPIGTVDPHLTPYLQGCIPQDREAILILDAEAIVNSPILG
jgi:positive phototaxis protein PixI